MFSKGKSDVCKQVQSVFVMALYVQLKILLTYPNVSLWARSKAGSDQEGAARYFQSLLPCTRWREELALSNLSVMLIFSKCNESSLRQAICVLTFR